MTAPLAPLQGLFDASGGRDLPLPADLSDLYGRLSFPVSDGRPYVYANFVSTLDGVVSLSLPGLSGGRPISGSNQHDRMVMGLLRAVAGAVIVGAGTVRDAGRHLWTAAFAYPPLAAAFGELRSALGIHGHPLNVFVTASGQIDLWRMNFAGEKVPVLLATTARGERQLAAQPLPPGVEIAVLAEDGPLTALAILETVRQRVPANLILTEGGPRLMAAFLAEGLLDELFLTLAPQIAGRDTTRDKPVDRPGFVAGRHFAPDQPQWTRLLSAKRSGSFLFLRYQSDRRPGAWQPAT